MNTEFQATVSETNSIEAKRKSRKKAQISEKIKNYKWPLKLLPKLDERKVCRLERGKTKKCSSTSDEN